MLFPAPYLWLCYMINESLMMTANLLRYRMWLKRDREEASPTDRRLYLTVEPDSAPEASRAIRKYGSEHGFSLRIVYRIGLCMEEMVAYAVASQKSKRIRIQVEVLFSHNGSRFTILDGGVCIALDEDTESVQLRADNYRVVRKIADSVNYQYILDMNYSVLTFQDEDWKNIQQGKNSPLTTEVRKYENGELVIAVDGQVDINTASAFLEDINRIRTDKSDGRIVFDCDRLVYISSAGFRVLLTLAQAETGESLKLINVDPVIADVFEDTGFTSIMEIVIKEQSAYGVKTRSGASSVSCQT